MHESQHKEPDSTMQPAPLEITRIRLVDAPAGAKVRLGDGRVVVATAILIQGARFVRPVLGDDLPLGSMLVLGGDQPVAVV